MRYVYRQICTRALWNIKRISPISCLFRETILNTISKRILGLYVDIFAGISSISLPKLLITTMVNGRRCKRYIVSYVVVGTHNVL